MDAYKKFARARAGICAFNMEIVIHDEELIIGDTSKFLRGALIFLVYKPNGLLFSMQA
jgi:hypothetical protein